MKKLLLTILAVAVLIPTANAGNYVLSDLTDDTEYLDSILWMNQNGVINGYPDGEFKPDKCVNRAEFLKMMFELVGQTDTAGQANPFKDVYQTEWYYPYVMNAYKEGIIAGYPDGTFKPGQCVNRVEAIKMAIEGMEIEIMPNDGSDPGFEDIRLDQWYTDYLYTAAMRNLVGINHTQNRNRFGVSEGMNRAEVAEMLFRITAMNANDQDSFEEWQRDSFPSEYVEPYYPEPEYTTPSIDDDAILGDVDAPITIIEFSDYECPFCRKFYTETFHLIKENYIDTGKVRFVYRDMPLAFHQYSAMAAISAECAGELGGDETYYAYHDLIFSSDNLSEEIFEGYAEDLDLDIDDFTACQDSEEILNEVFDDYDDASASGVSGTPTFFVNDEVISGAHPYEDFEEAIEMLLNQ